MENEKQMRNRHKKEFSDLRKKCKHKSISEWMDYYWAPGHILGKCKACNFCGKIMEKTWKEYSEKDVIKKATLFPLHNLLQIKRL